MLVTVAPVDHIRGHQVLVWYQGLDTVTVTDHDITCPQFPDPAEGIADTDDIPRPDGTVTQQDKTTDEVADDFLQPKTNTDTQRATEDGQGGEVQAGLGHRQYKCHCQQADLDDLGDTDPQADADGLCILQLLLDHTRSPEGQQYVERNQHHQLQCHEQRKTALAHGQGDLLQEGFHGWQPIEYNQGDHKPDRGTDNLLPRLQRGTRCNTDTQRIYNQAHTRQRHQQF